MRHLAESPGNTDAARADVSTRPGGLRLPGQVRRCICGRPIEWTIPGGNLPGYWSHIDRAYGHRARP